MVKSHNVSGHKEYTELLNELEKNNSEDLFFIMFSGSVGADGSSWCSDCNAAEPVVDKVLEQYKDRDDIHFIHVSVGERATWKDPKCPFRTDPKIKLTSIPTLIRWETDKRLEESECSDETLVELIFEGED